MDETPQLSVDPTPEPVSSLTKINQLLAFLVANAQSEIAPVLVSTLTINERTDANELISSKAPDGTAHSAIAGGTGIAKDSGLSKEENAVAFKVLKENNRVLQIGRGRGKCLIILDDTPLEGVIDVTMPTPSESKVDVLELLRILRDSYRNQIREVDEAQHNLSHEQRRIEELEDQLAQKDRAIADLRRQLAESSSTTWQ